MKIHSTLGVNQLGHLIRAAHQPETLYSWRVMVQKVLSRNTRLYRHRTASNIKQHTAAIILSTYSDMLIRTGKLQRINTGLRSKLLPHLVPAVHQPEKLYSWKVSRQKSCIAEIPVSIGIKKPSTSSSTPN